MKKTWMKRGTAAVAVLMILTAACGWFHSYAASGDTINLKQFTEEDYPSMTYFAGCSSPFVAAEFVQDRVNTLTGDLEVRQVDLSLKGKNGLDFELARYYNSGQSNESEIMEVSSDYATAPTYAQKRFDIGNGWEFDLPYVETRGNTKWFHFGSKGTWKVSSSFSSGLKDYTLSDMKFKTNDEYSTLTMKDGTEYHFSWDGQLTSIQNRFGDKITFFNGKDSYGWKYIKVTDTAGRIIDIHEVASGVEITVDSPLEESKTISYEINTYNRVEYKGQSYKKRTLESVTNENNETTQYTYVDSIATSGNTSTFPIMEYQYNYSSGYRTVGKTKCYLLKEIVMPTGAVNHYDYELKDISVDTRYKKGFFNVKTSYSYDGNIYGSGGDDPLELGKDRKINVDRYQEYAFITNYYSNQIQSKFIRLASKQRGKQCMAVYSDIAGSNPSVTLYEYTNNGQLKAKKMAPSFKSGATVRTWYQTETYTYESDTAILPKQKTMVIYNENQNTQTVKEDYTYDRYGDLTKLVADSAGKKITTEYTYSSVYQLPEMKKYDRDETHQVIERYTLTDDAKNIARKAVYESESGGAETLKEQTDYTYYPEGMLRQETAYLVTDETPQAETVIEYDYTDNRGRDGFNGLHVTKRSAVNHKRVNEQPDITAVNETISEQYVYDDYDNLISHTDPNNAVTENTYTANNKISRIKNADGSEKQFTYIVEQGDNRIIQTDENGNQRELIYDIYGNLRHERDTVTGKLLMSYEYNHQGQIISAFDYINSTSAYYTYNQGYGTLKSKEVRDEETWFAQQPPTYGVQTGSGNGTGWKYYGGSNCQQLTTQARTNTFDCLEQTIQANSGDYLFVKSPSIGTKSLYVSFKINGTWTDERLWEIYKLNEDKMAVKSADELGIAGQKIEGIKFYSNTINTCYVGSVGVLRGKSSSAQLQNIRYEYDYAHSGKYIKMTRIIDGDTEEQCIKENAYIDQFGNVVKKEQYLTDKTVYTADYTYDYQGNVLTERSPRANAENWENPSAQYVYDYAGRCISAVNAEGSSVSVKYDSLGRTVSETDYNGHAVSYEYDNLGRVLKQSTVLDIVNDAELLHTKLFAYDNNGNMTTQWTSSNEAGQAVTYDKMDYAYDAKGQLTQTAVYTDNTQADYTRYTYDAAGNQTALYTGLSAPLTDGSVNNTAGDYSVTKYAYDYLNRPIKTTDALGQEETYVPNYNGTVDRAVDRNGNVTVNTYDNLARLTKTEVTTPDGGFQTREYAYNKLGQTVSADGVSYEYDNFGRLLKETDSAENTVKEYTYDEAGNRKTFRLIINGITEQNLAYSYTKQNLLDNVQNLVDNIVVEQYTYDKNGNILTKYTPSTGIGTQYTYNQAGLITEETITTKNGTFTVGRYAYSYYANGNQSQKTADVNNSGEKTTQYIYDGAGRLTKEQTESQTTTYQYDPSGNRGRMQVNGGEAPFTTEYAYDKNNRLLEETKVFAEKTEQTQYHYDPNGNMISKLGTVTAESAGRESVSLTADAQGTVSGLYQYNGYNQLVSLIENENTASYTYDVNGLRTSKTVNGVTTKHIWDGTNMAAETDGTGAVTAKYYRGVGLIYGEQNGEKQYYLTNAHGDVDMLADGAGNIIKTYTYDEFGVEANKDEADTNPFRYAGEYYDGETDSIYLRARYYAPRTGRFTTEDPIRDGLNWYSYCGGNPVMRVDPSGLIYCSSDTQPSELNQYRKDNYAVVFEGEEEINIYINIYITESEMADEIAPDTGETYRQATVRGIIEGLNGVYDYKPVNVFVEDFGDDAEHAEGYTTLEIDVFSGFGTIIDPDGTERQTNGISWWDSDTATLQVIELYTGWGDSNYMPATIFSDIAGHEMGHGLGIMDAYNDPVVGQQTKYDSIMPSIMRYETQVNGAQQIDYYLMMRAQQENTRQYYGENFINISRKFGNWFGYTYDG